MTIRLIGPEVMQAFKLEQPRSKPHAGINLIIESNGSGASSVIHHNRIRRKAGKKAPREGNNGQPSNVPVLQKMVHRWADPSHAAEERIKKTSHNSERDTSEHVGVTMGVMSQAAGLSEKLAVEDKEALSAVMFTQNFSEGGHRTRSHPEAQRFSATSRGSEDVGRASTDHTRTSNNFSEMPYRSTVMSGANSRH
ncbi:hypothetical protein B0H17DRAFT_1133131 [Mycena rosella]|uniref:Uncharacterized protein n=1 Tax=Mycena rosella TaxID=1033263 RepID=A0AAD7DKL4_MYCRO|nr:hypothetical protein B0H17DRAFT_1133131 [Mycena rosella]